MKDRIIQIMNHERLTSSRFADTIGIQRAAMSHIILGRNNPSIDVYKKIIETFTYIDPDWLLSGTGNMMRKNMISEPDLFTNMAENRPEVQVASGNRREMEVETPGNDIKPIVQEKVIIQKIEPKKISEIIVYYSDNTIEYFAPAKNKKE